MVLRFSVFMAVIAALCFTPALAKAGVVEFFFPSLKQDKEEDLYETLRAPFAEGEAPKETLSIEDVKNAKLPTNNVPLELPHRQANQIAEYVADMISEALVYESGDYKADMEKVFKLFNDEGKASYKAFLSDKSIMKALESGEYNIRGFTQDMPVVLNSGAVHKRFRWLFEVPVMISYMKSKDASYEKGGEPINQRMSIRVQVGRYNEAVDTEGILIESWTGKIIPETKNKK